jgi:hypothetical protein
LVEQIMALGAEGAAQGWRLVGAGHRHENDARAVVAKIGDRVDVVLFAGPLQYDLAVAAGPLGLPATFVPVERGSLYAGLVRLMSGQGADPTRVSVDSLTAADVAAAYQAVGVDSERVQVRPYSGPESVREYTKFHADAFRRGTATGALTTVPSVCEELVRAGIPTIRLDPSPNTLRFALRTAALLGSTEKLKESQIALVIADVAPAGSSSPRGLSNYRLQEDRLALHRGLIEQARLMQATVHLRDDDGYLITATYGAVSRATDGLRSGGFVKDLAARLGIELHVGIGLGLTAREADEHARRAIGEARASDRTAAVVVDGAGAAVDLPLEPSPDRPPEPSTHSGRSLQLLADLVEGAVAAKDQPVVVDADSAAVALGVSRRSAQRALQALAADGLAWPMASAASKHAGRPRQLYRLVVERLSAGQLRAEAHKPAQEPTTPASGARLGEAGGASRLD